MSTLTLYIHCPKCDDFSRHFVRDMTSKIFCQKCEEEAPIADYKKPEVSDKWLVSVKGSEIAIVQEKDHHGRISCGWFSKTKVLIAEAAAPHGSSERSPVFDELVALANKEAEKRNKAL